MAALSRYSRGARRKKRDQIAANTIALLLVAVAAAAVQCGQPVDVRSMP
jgi:hypothetical protein